MPRKRNSRAPLRVAVVGAGRIGQTHLEAVATCPETELAAVCDSDDGAAAAAASRYDVPAFVDPLDEGLVEAADAVIVATPPASHFTVARRFLLRNVHVLCEKPLTLALDQAKALASASYREGTTLMMASKFRYMEDVVAARRLLDEGAIGEPVWYENVFAGRLDLDGRWNADPEVSGGGVLIDNGTHALDLARFLLGEIEEIDVQARTITPDLPVEDTVRCQFRSAQGVLGSIDLTWAFDAVSPWLVRITGTEGQIEIGWKESRLRGRGGAKDRVFGSGYDKLACFVAQLEDFTDVVRGTGEPRTRPEDALASVALVEAAYQAARNHRWTATPAEVLV